MKKLFTLLLFAFLISNSLLATDYTWSNPISGSGVTAYSKGDWNTSSNWSPNGVPTTGDNIYIDYQDDSKVVWIYNVPNVELGNMVFEINTQVALTGQNNGGAGFSTITIQGHGLRTPPIVADVIIFDNAVLYLDGTSFSKTELGVTNYPVKLDLLAGACFNLWQFGYFFPADFALANCATENPGFLLEGTSETNSAQFVQQIGNTQDGIRGAVQMEMLADKQHLISFPIATNSAYTTPALPSNICGMRNTLCVCQTDVVSKWGITQQSWQTLGNETCFTAATQIEPGKGYRIGGDGVAHPSYYHMPMGPFNNAGGTGINLKTYLPANNDEWALVGNPFPSALKFGIAGNPGAGFTWNSGQIAPYVQIWDGRSGSQFGGNTGHYKTYNWVTAAFTGWSNVEDAKYIPMFAGFFVQRIANPLSEFSVNNASREFRPTMPIFKSSANDETGPANFMQLSIAKDNEYLDEVGIMFWDGATESRDNQFDTPKFFGGEGATNIYSKTKDNADVVINTLPLTAETFTVPVLVKAGTNGTFSLNAKRTVNFNAKTTITLIDSKTGNSQDLRVNPVYSFTSDPADDPARFVVMFSGVSNGISTQSNIANVYSSGKSIYIQRTNPNENGTVIVYDLYGRTRIEENLGSTNLKVLSTSLSQGVYLVTILAGNGTYNKKVYIN